MFPKTGLKAHTKLSGNLGIWRDVKLTVSVVHFHDQRTMLGYCRLVSNPTSFRSKLQPLSTIPKPNPIKQCLERLTESYYRMHKADSNVKYLRTEMDEVICDLKLLHSNKFPIPRHFIEHGYRLAARGRPDFTHPDFFHGLTRIAVRNHSNEEDLKDILETGIKAAVDVRLFKTAYEMWTDNQGLRWSGDDRLRMLEYIHTKHKRFESKPIEAPVVNQESVQELCKAYHGHAHEMLHAKRTGSRAERKHLHSLLDNCTTTLQAMCSLRGYACAADLVPILTTPHMRSLIARHLRQLMEEGMHDCTLTCLDALLGCFGSSQTVPRVDRTMMGLLSQLPATEVALNNYLYLNPKAAPQDPKGWIYDIILQLMHHSADTKLTSEGQRVTKPFVVSEQLELAHRFLAVASAYALPLDGRLAYAFLESIHTRLKVEIIEESSLDEEEDEVLTPFSRDLRTWLEALPTASMKQDMLHTMIKTLSTKPTVFSMHAAAQLLEWSILRFAVRPITLSRVCSEVCAILFKDDLEKLDLFDKKITMWVNAYPALYGKNSSRKLLNPGRFALKAALHDSVGVLAILREMLQVPGSLQQSLFIKTIRAFSRADVERINENEDMTRFFKQVGVVVDWFHQHMVSRSTFTSHEAVDHLLRLYINAAEVHRYSKFEKKKLLDALDRYLAAHWLPQDQAVWTDLDTSILRSVFIFYCSVGRKDEALAKLLELDKERPALGILSAETLESFVRHEARDNKDFNAAEALVMEHLVNRGIPPNQGIVDCMVHLTLITGPGEDALDLAIDLHNQHGIWPSLKVIRRLLYRALEKKDENEVQRIKYFFVRHYGGVLYEKTLEEARINVALHLQEKEESRNSWLHDREDDRREGEGRSKDKQAPDSEWSFW